VDHLLQVLRVKGRATQEVLDTALDADTSAEVERLLGEGAIEETRFGFRVTDVGQPTVDELYERERAQAGPLIDDVYQAFEPINDDIKQIVTDWQMRSVGGELVLNDHSDAGHDEDVIARLHRADGEASEALAPLTVALPRFEIYPKRFQRALTSIGNGDHSMVAAPIKDSYHTVWFELHEELIILSGRERTE
jgi:pyruvate,orthophosphate dikinase